MLWISNSQLPALSCQNNRARLILYSAWHVLECSLAYTVATRHIPTATKLYNIDMNGMYVRQRSDISAWFEIQRWYKKVKTKGRTDHSRYKAHRNFYKFKNHHWHWQSKVINLPGWQCFAVTTLSIIISRHYNQWLTGRSAPSITYVVVVVRHIMSRDKPCIYVMITNAGGLVVIDWDAVRISFTCEQTVLSCATDVRCLITQMDCIVGYEDPVDLTC